MNEKLTKLLSISGVMLTASSMLGVKPSALPPVDDARFWSRADGALPGSKSPIPALDHAKSNAPLPGANLYKLNPVAVQQEIQELQLLLQSVNKRLSELQQVNAQTLQKPQQKDIVQSLSSSQQPTVKFSKGDMKPTPTKTSNVPASKNSDPTATLSKVVSASTSLSKPQDKNVLVTAPKVLDQKKEQPAKISPAKVAPEAPKKKVGNDALTEGELRRALSAQRRMQVGEDIRYKDEEDNRVVPSWQSAYVPGDDSTVTKAKQGVQQPKETALTEGELLRALERQRLEQAGERRQYISPDPNREISFTLPTYDSNIESATRDRSPEQQREIQKSIDDLMAAVAAEHDGRDDDEDWDDDDDDWLQY